jgi:hypothetical protein
VNFKRKKQLGRQGDNGSKIKNASEGKWDDVDWIDLM